MSHAGMTIEESYPHYDAAVRMMDAADVNSEEFKEALRDYMAALTIDDWVEQGDFHVRYWEEALGVPGEKMIDLFEEFGPMGDSDFKEFIAGQRFAYGQGPDPFL